MVDYGGVKPGMVSRMGALLVESPWMFSSRRLLGSAGRLSRWLAGGLGRRMGRMTIA